MEELETCIIVQGIFGAKWWEMCVTVPLYVHSAMPASGILACFEQLEACPEKLQLKALSFIALA